MKPRKVPTPGWNFEYLMWLFIRISGAAMFLLALIGFVGALAMGARTQMDLGTLMRWTFFPNPNHVLNSNIVDIAPWANAYWQIMQLAIVFFGATHGFNGLRLILEEYIHSWGWHMFLRLVLLILWLITLGAGFFLVLTS
ncbi:MAG: hypothetical protein GXO37_04820 [Chloroflexi bacterium]|nr:hypothetical protein [Chloroflexota bacterium]